MDVPSHFHVECLGDTGGFVFGGRLEEDLAVSRGFGDYRFKEEHITIHGICEEGVRTPGEQKVSPIPEMKFHARKAKHSYLFLGCDGVFEVMKTEKVAKTLSRSLASHKTDLEAAIVHVSTVNNVSLSRFLSVIDLRTNN